MGDARARGATSGETERRWAWESSGGAGAAGASATAAGAPRGVSDARSDEKEENDAEKEALGVTVSSDGPSACLRGSGCPRGVEAVDRDT